MSSLPYYCLEYLIEKRNNTTARSHFTQTKAVSVYLRTFIKPIKIMTNVKRSMSRVGTPTDNLIIESLNGWIREEMRTDFNLEYAGVYHHLLRNMFITSTMKDYLTNSNTKPLSNTELNKVLVD